MSSSKEKDNLTWSKDALQDVSRTFALSISHLPEPHRKHTRIAYLLCRIPDTIEDAPNLTAEMKQSLLDQFKQTLEQPSEEKLLRFEMEVDSIDSNLKDSSDWELVSNTGRVFSLLQNFEEDIQNCISPWVIEMTEGMKKFVERNKGDTGVRIDTRNELREYCYYVAGTVGHMVLDLLSVQYEAPVTEELHEKSEEYGLLLQFVNICKDVYDDYHTEDNIYLPNTMLTDENIPPEQLTNEEYTKNVSSIIEDLIQESKSYIDSAEYFLEWVEDTASESYTGWAIPYFLAIATIRELDEHREQAIKKEEVKISRKEVFDIVEQVKSSNDPSEMRKNLLKLN